jgi:hypothetical protein
MDGDVTAAATSAEATLSGALNTTGVVYCFLDKAGTPTVVEEPARML